MKRLLSIALSLILSNNLLIASSVSNQEEINKSINTLNTMKEATTKAKDALHHEQNIYEQILNKVQKNSSSSTYSEEISQYILESKANLAHAIKNLDTMNRLYESLHFRILADPNSDLAIAYQASLDQQDEADRAMLDEVSIDSDQNDELIPCDIEILDWMFSSSKSSPSNQSHASSASIGKRSFAEMDEATKYPPTTIVDRTSLRRTPKEITRYCNEDEEIRKLELKKIIKEEFPH